MSMTPGSSDQLIDEINGILHEPFPTPTDEMEVKPIAYAVAYQGVGVGIFSECHSGDDHFHFSPAFDEFYTDEPEYAGYVSLLGQLPMAIVESLDHAKAVASWLVKYRTPRSLEPKPELPDEIKTLLTENRLG